MHIKLSQNYNGLLRFGKFFLGGFICSLIILQIAAYKRTVSPSDFWNSITTIFAIAFLLFGILTLVFGVMEHFIPKPVGPVKYTYLDFTDCNVILGKKNPAQNELLSYNQTTMSLLCRTGIFPTQYTLIEYIARLKITFVSSKKTHTVELVFNQPSTISYRLLKYAHKFKSFEFSVTPDENPENKEQQKAADFIRKQIQEHLTFGQAQTNSPEQNKNMRWLIIGLPVVGLILLLLSFLPALQENKRIFFSFRFGGIFDIVFGLVIFAVSTIGKRIRQKNTANFSNNTTKN